MSERIGAEDWTEIANVIGRYQWLLDGGEAEAWAGLFTPDGAVRGVGEEVRGTAALKAAAAATFAGFRGRMRHAQSALWIEPGASREEAIARYYALVTTWPEGRPPELFNLGLCEVRLVRTAQGWKIRSNTITSLRAEAAGEAMGSAYAPAVGSSSDL